MRALKMRGKEMGSGDKVDWCPLMEKNDGKRYPEIVEGRGNSCFNWSVIACENNEVSSDNRSVMATDRTMTVSRAAGRTEGGEIQIIPSHDITKLLAYAKSVNRRASLSQNPTLRL
jgi:hypothetical protein